jgi:hypothetical protein
MNGEQRIHCIKDKRSSKKVAKKDEPYMKRVPLPVAKPENTIENVAQFVLHFVSVFVIKS